MDIEIKRLTPDLAEDYVRFFDETPHDDNVEDNKCYCVCWCGADHRVETDFSTVAKRRELAARYVRDGVIQGYLAYREGRAVGWCNANTRSDCIHSVSWLRLMQSLDIEDMNAKVKSIFCYVVALEMRKKGVATRLLERVLSDAEKDGFEYVEAYPKKEFVSAARDFMGPVDMYINSGFSLAKEFGKDRVVARKKINAAEE